MDLSELLPMLLMMQILPALTGSAGGGVASDNVVIIPVAIGKLDVNGGSALPVGVERDRRGSGRDRRDRPGGGGRRMADQLGPIIFGPGPFGPAGPFVPPGASPYFPY